jgi:hypothetical protein
MNFLRAETENFSILTSLKRRKIRLCPHRVVYVVYDCEWQSVVFDRFSCSSVWTQLCHWETIQSHRIECVA